MQFLVLTKRRMEAYPAEQWTPELIAAESQRVREMYASGSLRSIWRRKDMPGAAILFEAQRGMIEFPLITQLEPYPGFGPR